MILYRYVRQKAFDIDKNSMTAGRSENGNAVFESAPQVVHLLHTAGYIRIAGKNFLQRDSHRFHRHAGRLAPIKKILHRSSLIVGFVAHGNDTAHRYEEIFEGAHRAAVGQCTGLVNDLLKGTVLIAWLALFDQIAVL